MSSLREEVAQRKPLERVFSGLFRKQKGRDPFEIPGVPDLQCLSSRACLRVLAALSLWSAIASKLVSFSTINLPSYKLGSLNRRKAFLLCKNPCGTGFGGGRGSSPKRTHFPSAKKFPEEICFALDRVLQICRTPRLLSVQKYAGTYNRYTCPYRAAWGARGVATPLFEEESRGTPFQGVPLGNFFLTADAVLLCAAKKNSDSRWRLCRLTDMGCRAGVGTWTSWHVTPEAHWPYLATAESNDYSSSCSGSTLSIEITRFPSSTLIKITPCVSRL